MLGLDLKGADPSPDEISAEPWPQGIFGLKPQSSKGEKMTISGEKNWFLVISALLLTACSAPEEETAAAPEAPLAGGMGMGAPQYGMENLSGNLYQAGVRSGGGGHNTVVLLTSEGAILGDPINAGFSEWLRTELAGNYDTEVRYVLYSHHHPDHASGGAVFEDTATFVGHVSMVSALEQLPSNSQPMDANGNGTIERDEAQGGFANGFDRDDTNQDNVLTAAEINQHTRGPDITFTDRLTITLGDGTVEMHHPPPAHSDDIAVLLFPDYDVVFSVDFLQVNRLPGGLTGFLAGYSVDEYETAIGAVQALDFDTLVQGHSDILGSRSDVEDFLALLLTLESDVAAAIAAGSTLEETLESVMLEEYTDWLLYETRRPQLVSNMYEFLTQ